VSHGFQALLGSPQGFRIKFEEATGELLCGLAQIGGRHGLRDQPDLLGFLSVEQLAGQTAIERVTIAEADLEDLAYEAARKNPPIYLRQPELGVLRCKSKIASDQLGKGPAHAESVDHGNGR